MCGLTRKYTWWEIWELCNLTSPAPNLQPRYNICPTTTIDAVVAREGKRELIPMRWGLVPARKWLKSGYLESNFVLDGLERRLREAFPRRGKGSERGRAAQVHLIRYADDFIITGHHETFPSAISASGSGCCRAPGRLAHRTGAEC
jgi:hypothetical protein